jgi:hypothetical protein
MSRDRRSTGYGSSKKRGRPQGGLYLRLKTRLNHLMRAVIVLMVLTAILHLGLRYYITPQLSRDVRDRFIERGRYIPSLKEQHLSDNDGA